MQVWVAGSHVSTVQGLPSSQSELAMQHPATGDPTQIPAWHISFVVHTLPSSHVVPGAFGAVTHPKPGSQKDFMHGSAEMAHTTTPPPVQTPPWQDCPTVQASASLQIVPSALFGLTHCPVDGLQYPSSWH